MVNEEGLRPKGNLYTSNPNGLKHLKEDAELWQITRGGYTLPNTLLVRRLSPSPSLFQTFTQDWKGKPFSEWWPKYESRFIEELKSEEKIRGLRDVYKELIRGKNIVLICFCQDHRFCHRRLVGEFFKPYGVEAIELNPVKSEQITLF